MLASHCPGYERAAREGWETCEAQIELEEMGSERVGRSGRVGGSGEMEGEEGLRVPGCY